jgi:hypothetical protein
MVMVFLFILYCGLFSWLLLKTKFVQQAGLHKYWVISIFLIKIAAGCFYGYIHYKPITDAIQMDTWKFYYQSLPETALLKEDPLAFLQNVLGNNYVDGGTGYFATSGSYWNDLKHNMMLFIMSIFNLFSFSNYYINIIFFNSITFLGGIAFYRFCKGKFEFSIPILVLLSFFIPSFVFWGSGFHKEGLLFTIIAFIFYYSDAFIQHKKKLFYFIAIILLAILLLLLRHYLLLFLLPFLLVWIILEKFSLKQKMPIYISSFLLFIVFFFSIKYIFPQLNLPQYTSHAQKEFLNLPANTKVATDSLQPTVSSFIQNLPEALDMAFLRPSPKEASLTYLPSIIENIILITLCIFSLFCFKKSSLQHNTTLVFICFTLITMLFLGYTVPISGAIIRYKSILLPFLAMAIFSFIDFKKIKWKSKYLDQILI